METPCSRGLAQGDGVGSVYGDGVRPGGGDIARLRGHPEAVGGAHSQRGDDQRPLGLGHNVRPRHGLRCGEGDKGRQDTGVVRGDGCQLGVAY